MGIGVKGRGVGKRGLGVCMCGEGGGEGARRLQIKKECKPTNLI